VTPIYRNLPALSRETADRLHTRLIAELGAGPLLYVGTGTDMLAARGARPVRHQWHTRTVTDVEDVTCAVAHGAPFATATRTLVAVFASPVAGFLLHYGQDLDFRPILIDPDPARAAEFAAGDTSVFTAVPVDLDDTVDVVVTDHHRSELGPILRDLLRRPVRWIGLMGNARHAGPHIPALRELGVADEEIARVHRPIGLNIGSRTPPEIAISTLAGLLADRADRPGGFSF
jgi:xanthine/CO dehydrogenase XdhC/CoxF family maturation factor